MVCRKKLRMDVLRTVSYPPPRISLPRLAVGKIFAFKINSEIFQDQEKFLATAGDVSDVPQFDQSDFDFGRRKSGRQIDRIGQVDDLAHVERIKRLLRLKWLCCLTCEDSMNYHDKPLLFGHLLL